jgi:NAD(P)H-dependent FMN reductase
MHNVPVILGSVREGRKSEAPAKYLIQKLQTLGYQTQLVDFKKLALPFYNAPTVPVVYYKTGYPNAAVQQWSDIARAANGFIIVTPEYNHGYPAVLKNALDWLYTEFEHKPFGLVGVSSGTVGGARVIEQLRTVIENFGAVAIKQTLMLGPIEKYFDETGKLLEPSFDKRIENFITGLQWWLEKLQN